jgi:alanyl-tRNA synthetase
MEFNRLPGGILEPLRFTSVDTGSGLERMAMVLQGRDSAYETDLFAPIVAAVESAFAGTSAGQRDIRIVADHVRASTFILSEGVTPSNEGRGYIPRRLLRKAIAVATQAGATGFDLGDVFLIVSEGSIGSGVRRIEAVTGEAAVQRALERDRLLRGLAGRLRVPVDQLPLRVEALTARSRPRQARLATGPLADAVRVAPSGRRYLVAQDPDIAVPDLTREARRLSSELDTVVVLLLPDPQSGSLRIGISVPDGLTAQVTATAVLDQILAVTGGRGGGSAALAQGGGAQPDDLPAVVSRIWAALTR